MDSGALKQRTKKYALDTMRLVGKLPSNSAGRAIGNQLMRSGTSVAANYRAALRGRSRVEFIAKIGIVIEEVDESELWLELVSDGGLLPIDIVNPLLKETRELLAIFVSTSKTAKNNKK